MVSSLQPGEVEPGGVDVAPVVPYDTQAFTEHVETLMAHRDDRSGTRFLFYGGVREMRQQALGTLTRFATGNVHQFRMPSLLAEYRMQTQNNLRKAFDHAAEENALLFFDGADPLFTHVHADEPDDGEPSPAPTTVEYFFDRIVAYAGMVVIGLQRKAHVERARDIVHLVVRFEDR